VNWLKKELDFLLRNPFKAIDEETVRDPSEAGRASWRVLVVLLTCAVVLTLQEYVGGSDRYAKYFPYDGSKYWELMGFVWWSGWRVLGYVIIPIIVIIAMPGERLRDYNLSFKNFPRHFLLYLGMYLVFLPVVITASKSAEFRHTYPFYRMANRSQLDLWAWEALYAAQFVSLEFFFRGFLLQGLRRALGANAIFVMIVPYCMIHYGKPMPETFGAILAGLLLGTLAMRTRSIWGGVLIHIGVATTMDVMALAGCPTIGSGKFCH
jgi:membrane protease YdiL (CAAX protease family)